MAFRKNIKKYIHIHIYIYIYIFGRGWGEFICKNSQIPKKIVHSPRGGGVFFCGVKGRKNIIEGEKIYKKYTYTYIYIFAEDRLYTGKNSQKSAL